MEGNIPVNMMWKSSPIKTSKDAIVRGAIDRPSASPFVSAFHRDSNHGSNQSPKSLLQHENYERILQAATAMFDDDEDSVPLRNAMHSNTAADNSVGPAASAPSAVPVTRRSSPQKLPAAALTQKKSITRSKADSENEINSVPIAEQINSSKVRFSNLSAADDNVLRFSRTKSAVSDRLAAAMSQMSVEDSNDNDNNSNSSYNSTTRMSNLPMHSHSSDHNRLIDAKHESKLNSEAEVTEATEATVDESTVDTTKDNILSHLLESNNNNMSLSLPPPPPPAPSSAVPNSFDQLFDVNDDSIDVEQFANALYSNANRNKSGINSSNWSNSNLTNSNANSSFASLDYDSNIFQSDKLKWGKYSEDVELMGYTSYLIMITEEFGTDFPATTASSLTINDALKGNQRNSDEYQSNPNLCLQIAEDIERAMKDHLRIPLSTLQMNVLNTHAEFIANGIFDSTEQ